jgi:hypothetical protein
MKHVNMLVSNHILFAICDTLYSKLRIKRYTVASRRSLRGSPLEPIGSRTRLAFVNQICKLNLINENYKYDNYKKLLVGRPFVRYHCRVAP